MSKKALIRVDGSWKSGMGHVTRCVSFAQSLRKHDIDSAFIIRNQEPEIIDFINRWGFEVNLLNKKISLQEDAMQTKEMSEELDVDFLLVDLSTTENLNHKSEFFNFFEIVKSSGKYLLIFEDFENIEIACDLAVIPYLGAEDIPYKVFKDTKHLLGCAYFIASRALINLAAVDRVIRKDARKVLVVIGGSDPTSLSLDVFQALCGIQDKQLDVKFVIGECFDDLLIKNLKEKVKAFVGKIEYCYKADIPRLMLWADLVITGEGLTRYEAALIGTPNLVVTRTDLTKDNKDKFIDAKIAKHISVIGGDLSEEISKEIKSLLEDYSQRKRMSALGKKTIDGRGSERIINEMKREVFV